MVEETLLQQIKVVNKGQDFVVWISNFSAVTVHVGKKWILVCDILVQLSSHR